MVTIKVVFLFCLILLDTSSILCRNVDANNRNVSEEADETNVLKQERSDLNSKEIVFYNFSRQKDELETGQVVSPLSSPFCRQDVHPLTSLKEKKFAAGCIMGSLIPRDKTYLVNY
jgi:hypothetical protein